MAAQDVQDTAMPDAHHGRPGRAGHGDLLAGHGDTAPVVDDLAPGTGPAFERRKAGIRLFSSSFLGRTW